MATNFPGPYELEIEYIVPTLTHHMRLNCAAVASPIPGTPFNTIQVMTRGGSPASLETSMLAFWAFIRPMMHTTVTAGSVTLWKYPTPGSYVRQFISAYAGALAAGTAAVAPILAAQLTHSFRSANGGSLKLMLLENSSQNNAKVVLSPNAAGNSSQQLAAYILSSGGWIMSRDDAFPIAATFVTSGQNEAVYKKRYRP